MKSDLEIRQDVFDELRWEPMVHASQIGVTVREGIVTLTGHVESYQEKWDAERAAKRVEGVKAMTTELDVKVPAAFEKSDSEIALAAARALEWNVSVPHDRIKVTVENGQLTLDGNVERQYQKEAAFKSVQNLIGIRWVRNNISVNPGVPVPDLKANIEAAFKRSAYVDAQDVKIDLIGNKVILHGNVHSWLEREEAERIAWSAHGVTAVQDELIVS